VSNGSPNTRLSTGIEITPVSGIKRKGALSSPSPIAEDSECQI